MNRDYRADAPVGTAPPTLLQFLETNRERLTKLNQVLLRIQCAFHGQPPKDPSPAKNEVRPTRSLSDEISESQHLLTTCLDIADAVYRTVGDPFDIPI